MYISHNSELSQIIEVTFSYFVPTSLLIFPDETRIETLFVRCKGSIEKSKQTIDMYYTVRSVLPEIFCSRDPYERWFKHITSIR
jgi:hypothetical protein